MIDAAAGDDKCDAAASDQAAVLVVVVAAISVDSAWPATRFADDTPEGWDGVDERDQPGDIVAVPAGEHDGQWDAARVGDQVVLGAELAAVDRARPVWSPFESVQVSGVDQGRRQVQQPGGAQFGEQ